MKPYLVEWVFQGSLIRLPSFGVFLALAFSFSYFWSLHNARQLKIGTKHMERLFLLILVSSIVGGRLFHVFFEEPNFYLAHPSKIPAVWEGGFTFYGAMLTSLLSIWLYARIYFLNSGTLLDIIATSTLMSLCIGRIGCFLAGCCWGKSCTLPWAVTFSHPEVFNTVKGIRVHPSQLYESIGAFLLFVFCQKQIKVRKFSGEIGLKALLGYSILRFMVEYSRGDSYRGFILGGFLSYSQAISILMATGASLALLKLRPAKDLS